MCCEGGGAEPSRSVTCNPASGLETKLTALRLKAGHDQLAGKSVTPSHCAPIVSSFPTSQVRHSTRAGMFTSRGQKADRPVTPNGYSFVLKIQDGKSVLLLGINLVLGTVFSVDLDCWYAINTALPFQIQIFFMKQR